MTSVLGRAKFLLWILPLLAVVLRCYDLECMEFKADEFETVRLSLLNLSNPPAEVGLISSTGLRNPPILIYIMSLPALVSQEPLTFVAVVVAANLAGLAILYLFVRRYFDSTIAFWSLTLFASTPWAIILARKIWAQDLLFPIWIAMLFLFFSAQQDYRRYKVVGVLVLLSMLVQMHMSAVFLLPALLIYVLLFRPQLRIADLAIGAVLAGMLWVPYIWFHIHTEFANVHEFLEQRKTTKLAPNPLGHFYWMLAVSSGGVGFEFMLGRDGAASFYRLYSLKPLLGLFAANMLAGFVAVLLGAGKLAETASSVWKKQTITDAQRIVALLVLTIISVHLCYALLRVPVFPHYHAILYPSVAILVAVAALSWRENHPRVRSRASAARYRGDRQSLFHRLLSPVCPSVSRAGYR